MVVEAIGMQHLEEGLVEVLLDGVYAVSVEMLGLYLCSSYHHSIGEGRFVFEVEVEGD